MFRPKIFSLVFWLTLCVYLSGCMTATDIKPFLPGSEIKPQTEGEKRLWYEAEKIEEAIEKGGQIYENEAIRAYIQSVTDRLYPEYKEKFKVHLLKAPVLNAFVLPNGSIYVNKGILAACQNEAQIASILAHEGIHFVNKHSALGRQKNRSVSGAAVVLSIGLPIISQLVAASSIFGYSRDLEREADRKGFVCLKKAGYDIREAPKSFELLAMEAEVNEEKEPFFFSTHPELQERIDMFYQLIKEAKTVQTGDIGRERYQKYMADLRLEVLEEKINVGKYNAVIAVLTSDKSKDLYAFPGMFYLGEAYRLRNNADDCSKAIATYREIMKEHPSFAPAHQSMGIIFLKQKQYKKARQCLVKYLELKPDAEDKAFIRQYLHEIESMGI
ncbi:MAG: M48 family metallopeptidase [Thermodesulfobacteriota bacterium]|nr:M48 family metallopeptidase [Thermodesulfobacteriota bacterium]